MFSRCPWEHAWEAASTSYFGTVSGEAHTSISGLPQKTLFAMSTFFSTPRGKRQELCCWPCTSVSAGCWRRVIPSAQHVPGLQPHNQSLQGALRDPRGASSQQCTHLCTGLGLPLGWVHYTSNPVVSKAWQNNCRGCTGGRKRL